MGHCSAAEVGDRAASQVRGFEATPGGTPPRERDRSSSFQGDITNDARIPRVAWTSCHVLLRGRKSRPGYPAAPRTIGRAPPPDPPRSRSLAEAGRPRNRLLQGVPPHLGEGPRRARGSLLAGDPALPRVMTHGRRQRASVPESGPRGKAMDSRSGSLPGDSGSTQEPWRPGSGAKSGDPSRASGRPSSATSHRSGRGWPSMTTPQRNQTLAIGPRTPHRIRRSRDSPVASLQECNNIE